MDKLTVLSKDTIRLDGFDALQSDVFIFHLLTGITISETKNGLGLNDFEVKLSKERIIKNVDLCAILLDRNISKATYFFHNGVYYPSICYKV